MSKSAVHPNARSVDWAFIFLAALGSVVLFRLFVWKLIRGGEVFFKEDASNLAVAFFPVLFSVIWLAVKIIKKQSVRLSGMEIPLGILLAAVVGSIFYTVDLSTSLKGGLVLVAQVIFFVMLVDVLDRPEKVKGFTLFLFGAALVVAFFGVKEFFYLWNRPEAPTDIRLLETNDSLFYILNRRRITSFLGWPNTLAGYLLLFLPAAMLLPWLLKGVKEKILGAVAAVMIVGAFLFTFSFLGWISFFLAFLILLPFIYHYFEPDRWSVRQRALIGICFVVFLGLFVWVVLRKDLLGSFLPRIMYYKNAWHLLIERPWLGWGWDTFGIASRPLVDTRNALTGYVHNTYLQAWVETGLAGFMAWMGIIVIFIRRIRSSFRVYTENHEKIFFLTIIWGLTAFFVDNVFSFTMIKPNVSLHFWVMLAVFCALTNQGKDRKEIVITISRGWLGVVCIGVCQVLFVITRLGTGFLFYRNGREAIQQHRMEDASRSFKMAEKWNPWEPNFRLASGDVLLRAALATKNPMYLKLAEQKVLEAVKISPQGYSAYFILGVIYGRMGEIGKSKQYSEKARQLSPFEFERDITLLEKRAASQKRSQP